MIPTSHCVYFLDAERLQGMITSVIDALVGADRRAEDVASSASDVSAFPRLVASHYELNLFSFAKIAEKQALGKKLFGPTAEFEQKKAEPIAPSASHAPITVGRRSRRADGIVSFSISHRAALTGEPDELISYFS